MAERCEEVVNWCRQVFEAKTGLPGMPTADGRAKPCEADERLREFTDEELLAELQRRKL